MKLAIISHTEHYTTDDGTLVGWGPTVNEINHLLEVFDTIVHVAMHHDGEPPRSTMAYASNRITFVPIPTVGGRNITDKINILWNAPRIVRTVSKVLKQVDYFQLRTPTGIGVFLIPFLTFFVKKKGWFKYAGNWNQKQPPLGYGLQRWLLKHQSRKVTINGHWDHQPKHCITFENPCLTLEDIQEGATCIKHKRFEGSLSFCFVGRLEQEKGVECIIKAFALFSENEKAKISKVHLVGEGKDSDRFKTMGKATDIPFVFHGSLSRSEVFEIYKQSHAFLLPTTASEGFPKVIAEAMAFGCIPVVSKVSSIGQYIKHQEQGLLLEVVTPEALAVQLRSLFVLDTESYHKMIPLQRKVVQQFTFAYYNKRIKTQILT